MENYLKQICILEHLWHWLSDLVKILNANSDEVAEIINNINKKYNNKESV
jgi:hypothetical protein